MRKQITIASLIAATLGVALGTGAWATRDVNQSIAATEENATEIANATLTINESNISCDGQPDGKVLVQPSSAATVSVAGTVLITGEGTCANLRVPNATNYPAQAFLQDKYWGFNSSLHKWMYLNTPGCAANGPRFNSTEGAWVQTPLDALCTLPNFVPNGSGGFIINPALNTLHEVVWTVVFPSGIRPTYSVPSAAYFVNG